MVHRLGFGSSWSVVFGVAIRQTRIIHADRTICALKFVKESGGESRLLFSINNASGFLSFLWCLMLVESRLMRLETTVVLLESTARALN